MEKAAALKLIMRLDIPLRASNNKLFLTKVHVWDVRRPFIPFASFERAQGRRHGAGVAPGRPLVLLGSEGWVPPPQLIRGCLTVGSLALGIQVLSV